MGWLRDWNWVFRQWRWESWRAFPCPETEPRALSSALLYFGITGEKRLLCACHSQFLSQGSILPIDFREGAAVCARMPHLLLNHPGRGERENFLRCSEHTWETETAQRGSPVPCWGLAMHWLGASTAFPLGSWVFGLHTICCSLTCYHTPPTFLFLPATVNLNQMQ